MRRAAFLAGVFCLGCASLAWADLTQTRAEQNPEKRSRLALENATAAYKAAREAYDKGDLKAVADDINEIQESVELAYTSLKSTGKDPRKSPKWFKKAEIDTRDLLRRLEAFEHDMNFDDRSLLQTAKARVQEVHDNLLIGLMEGKHR
jgi:hypothetical protein